MKKLIFLSLLVLCLPLTISAQKKTTQAHRTPARSASATQSNPVATSGKFTIYDFCQHRLTALFIGRDNIYIVERGQQEGGGNCLYAISTATGEMKTLVPERKVLYEGEDRPYIQDVIAFGDKLFITTPENLYTAPIDNPTVANWKIFLEGNWTAAVSRDGRVLALSSEKETRVYKSDLTLDFLWDDFFERLTEFSNPLYAHCKVSNNGTLYCFRVVGYDAMLPHFYVSNKGKKLVVLEDKNDWTLRFSNEQKASQSNYSNALYSQIDDQDSLYLSYYRRIYRVPASAPGNFDVHGKVPATEPGAFGQFAINTAGDILSFNNHSTEKSGLRLLTKKDQKWMHIGDYFETDLYTSGSWKKQIQYWHHSGDLLLPDRHGNFILSHDNNSLMIYNPDGINGFSQTKGKYVKPFPGSISTL